MSPTFLDHIAAAAAELLKGYRDRRMLGARLASIVADARGDWGQLVDQARRSQLDQDVAALVMARCARAAALADRHSDAESLWQEALRWAGEAHLPDDASSWIDCIIQMRLRAPTLDPGISDLAARAAALGEGRSGQRLVVDTEADWRRALDLLSKDPPDIRAAIEPLVRIRWAHAAAGDLADELRATARLGDVLRMAGERDAAMSLYVAASAYDKAQALAEDPAETPFHLASLLIDAIQDQKATAYLAISKAADLIPDDEVGPIGSAALADLSGVLEGRIADRPFSPRLMTSAVDALGSIADRLSEETLDQVMRVLTPSLDRTVGSFALTDESFCALLESCAKRADIDILLRRQAAEALARSLLIMPIAGANPNRLLRLRDENPELDESVESVLLPAVEDGAKVALVVLSDHPAVRESVKSAAEAALARINSLPEDSPGRIGIGISFGEDAWLVRSLGDDERVTAIRGLMARAAREGDALINRESALLAIPSLAQDLDSDKQQELFDELIPFGRGDRDTTTVDLGFGKQHPLSNVQFNMGPTSLVPAGLQAASIFAVTDENCAEVVALCLAALSSRSPAELSALVRALATIPASIVSHHLPLLVQDPRDELRALAAAVWTQSPDDPALGRRIISDRSAVVRLTLASNLHRVAVSAEPHDSRRANWIEPVNVLCDDVRATVRHLARSARGALVAGGFE